jgi:heme oxygenase (biliverdin-IX-beta and delta-forming)
LSDTDSAHRDYLALRDQVNSAQLATLTRDANPEASYAPCVWFEGDCFVFLSELASHTQNLKFEPSISLLLIEAETAAGNAFARKRISLFGRAQIVARADDIYKTVINDFYHRFGEVMKLIEPLPDFHLFRIRVQRGRFIRGFGQAYELAGDRLEQLIRIDPGK